MSLELQGRIKEDLTDFFENPDRERLRKILAKNDGEHDNLDFKHSMISPSKLARHILAFANSGGGAIIFGVTEEDDGSFSIVGLDDFEDPANISDEVNEFLPESIHSKYTLESYEYSASEYNELSEEKFQVLFIEYDPLLIPVVSTHQGSGINEGKIYIRDNTESKQANSTQIKSLIQKRMTAEAEKPGKDLKEDLEQLDLLYDYYPADEEFMGSVMPEFPNEKKDLEKEHKKYMRTLIEFKKDQIASIIGYNYEQN